ncbi:MAG: hypothetical protein ACK5HL_01725 [Bacilli bacterium]
MKNVSSKLSVLRILLIASLFLIMIFPFEMFNFAFPSYIINNKIIVNLRFIISGVIFLITYLLSILSRIILVRNNKAKNRDLINQLLDNVLLYMMLIILLGNGHVNILIVITIVVCDLLISYIKTITLYDIKSKFQSLKEICIAISITFALFYNLPFELLNIMIVDFLFVLSSIVSIISLYQYFEIYKNLKVE